ncbi:MAG: flap endonuclease-1 [Thermoprotei archaeon]|nr:MAG: flap endonuclease-1 [Thermoprotei archaeon]
MGVGELGELIPKKTISLEDLSGKVIAIDAYNALYQFLAIIRQPDGTPLKDSKGRTTSHLSGLLYRTINLLEIGIKPVYVFDGKPPEFKNIEILRRKKIKEEAVKKYEEALAKGDLEAAKRYAQMTSRLTDQMVADAKMLLDYMGVPWIQAPAEGEAQAAHVVKRGDAWAVGSQDYDSLLFGAPRLVRNITISGKRKLPRKNVYVEVKPELVELNEVLKILKIDRRQLIDMAILLGTDYNPDGVKSIGPKRAYRLIREFKSLENLKHILREAYFPVDPLTIREYFLNPEVTDEYKIEWKDPDEKALIEFLCEEHDFSETRVKNAIERLKKAVRNIKTRVSLDIWFQT